MTPIQGSILGNSVLRREDPTLLTGADKYLDDLDVDGLGYVQFVRSSVAHASVKSIDVNDARSMPGVIEIYTSENMAIQPQLGMPLFPPAFARPLLATNKVRFVGDILAIVVAESRPEAADAAENVHFDFNPLPTVIHPEASLREEAPLLFEEAGSNICFETGINQDGDDPLINADHVAEVRVLSQRLAGVPIESNGIVAVPDGNKLTAWASTQNPNSVRDAIAPILGIDTDSFRVLAPAVGGGFGPKAGHCPEYVLTCKAAQMLGRPLKWSETRSENMLAMFQGRGMTLKGKLGLKKDGTIVGFDAEAIADAGAYPAIGAFLTFFTQTMIQGVYKIPLIRFKGTSVVTNTAVTGAYRGAGRPEATQLLERLMDVAADDLGIDPVEIRRNNLLQPSEFPLTTHGGANYDSGDYEKSLNKVLEAADYRSLLAEQADRRTAGGSWQLGIGISTYVEITAPTGLHVEYGAIEITKDGTVIGRVGTSAHGQGHITSFSMVISNVLGIPMEDITILQSDTNEIPRGAGTMGSRSLQTAGSAVHTASETVLEKGKTLAAHLLEANVNDIVVGEGGLHVAGVPANRLSWAELARASYDDSLRPEGIDSGLAHEVDFDGTDATFPFGAHLAVVEVDTETGQVQLLRHVAVDDCGRILNPMLVTGQQHGGIAQGIAQALYEGVFYDSEGNPITGNLMDYGIPSAAEFPSFETQNTETPSPHNPLGAKGIGESGTIGSTPAIQNAVVDAVSHLGVKHIDMPLTAMRVWDAITTVN